MVLFKKMALLRPRGRGTYVAAFCLLAVVICIMCLKKGEDKLRIVGLPDDITLYMVVCTIDAILVTFIAEFFRRCFILHEEIFHLKYRYESSFVKMLIASFGQGNKRMASVIALIGCSTFGLAILKVNPMLVVDLLVTRWNVVFITVISAVAHLIGLREPTKAEMSQYMEDNRLNVGHGMAWSFYFGYLRLILPNFDVRVANWIKTHAPNSLYSPKLHILVPRSCYCYPSLKEADPRIEAAGNPDAISASRAGTIERIYKNTIYKIKGPTEKDTYYFVAEYATPILSLYEMAESNEAGLSAEEKLNQQKQFFTTLTHILSRNPVLGRGCVLVAYDDKREGEEIKIGDVLKDQVDADILDRERSRAG